MKIEDLRTSDLLSGEINCAFKYNLTEACKIGQSVGAKKVRFKIVIGVRATSDNRLAAEVSFEVKNAWIQKKLIVPYLQTARSIVSISSDHTMSEYVQDSIKDPTEEKFPDLACGIDLSDLDGGGFDVRFRNCLIEVNRNVQDRSRDWTEMRSIICSFEVHPFEAPVLKYSLACKLVGFMAQTVAMVKADDDGLMTLIPYSEWLESRTKNDARPHLTIAS